MSKDRYYKGFFFLKKLSRNLGFPFKLLSYKLFIKRGTKYSSSGHVRSFAKLKLLNFKLYSFAIFFAKLRWTHDGLERG